MSDINQSNAMNIEDDEIARLKERLARLESALVNSNIVTCPLCGSRMSKSTRYDNFYCLSLNGHCGLWVLAPVSDWGNKKPSSYFIRTTVKNGRVERPELMYTPFKLVLFVAGEEVNTDDDPASAWNLQIEAMNK